MTEIYLCRHGRTVLNAAGVLRGRLDPDLDEVGRAQADALAERLTGRGTEKPIRVVSSPLRRAVHTATPLAVALGRRSPVRSRWSLTTRCCACCWTRWCPGRRSDSSKRAARSCSGGRRTGGCWSAAMTIRQPGIVRHDPAATGVNCPGAGVGSQRP